MKVGWRIKANMVAFFVLALGLIYLMATQVLTILEDRYSVYAYFPDAGGVFSNQEVTYRGITVGSVGRMEVVEDGVKIELSIDSEQKIPAEDVEARVMFKSAVGEQFVDLLPSSNGEPFLEDGDEIPIERTDIPVSTQELLSTLEAVLQGVPPESLERAVDALGEGLTGRGRDIGTILESSADLAVLFAERAPEVEGILKQGTRFGGAFLETKEDFAEAIHQLVTVSEALSESTSDLHRLMIGSNLVSDEVVALIRENRGDLHAFLRQFAELNVLQAQHAGDLLALFKYLPSGLENVVKTFEPRTGLVRFGLINDEHEEPPACSYGTDRRRPSDRSPKLPPKNARCGRARNQASGGGFSSSQSFAPEPELPAVPARMSDWSWTLFYLNGINPS